MADCGRGSCPPRAQTAGAYRDQPSCRQVMRAPAALRFARPAAGQIQSDDPFTLNSSLYCFTATTSPPAPSSPVSRLASCHRCARLSWMTSTSAQRPARSS
jgi:hypothetical protein